MAHHERDLAKEGVWREVLGKFASSGMSVRAFCKQEQLSESQFYAWRRTIEERDQSTGRPPAFVPAVISGEAVRVEELVLKLGDGLELQLPPATPAERVAELVRALQATAAS